MADVNGDGRLDLVTANNNTSTAGVLLGLAGGGFGTITTFSTGAGSGPRSIAVADVNGDGKPDLLTANLSNTAGVLLGTGTGSFGTVTTFSTGAGSNPFGIAVADVNGDGRPDIVTANSGSNSAGVLLNTAAFPPTVTTTAPASATASATGSATGSATVTLGGNVTSDGGASVTDRGVVYVLGTGTPSIGGAGVTQTSASPATGTGIYSISATGFVPATTYTVRAYATNSQGTSYGAPLQFATSAPTAVVWTGATSTDWATNTNWLPAAVPTSSIDVTIPAAPLNQPVVSGTQFAKNLTVQTGASLTLAATTAPTTQLTLGAGNGGTNVGSLTLASGSTFTQRAASEVYITGDLTNNGATFALDATSEIGFGVTSTSNNHILNGTAGVTFQTLTVGEQGNNDILQIFVPVRVRRKLGVYNNSSTSVGTGGSVLLLSDASGTALIENGDAASSVGGPITIQRYIDPSLNPGAGYRHYAAPVSNTTLADLTATGYTPDISQATTYNGSPTPGTTSPFPTLFAYDQNRLATVSNNYSAFDKGFVVPTNLSAAMLPSKGYVAQVGSATLVDFVGSPTSGTSGVNLSRNAAGTANAAAAGWQLVGNPYPAPLDYSLVLAADRPNLDAGMYVVQSTGPYAGGYRAYVNGQSTTATNNPLIASSQGFWVRVSAGQTTGSLIFRNAQRVTDYTSQAAFQRSTPDPRPAVRLELSGAGLADAWVAYAETGASAAFDSQIDAAKLPNSHGLNLSSATASENVAIDGQAASTAATVLPLSVGVPAAEAYSLSAASLNNLPAGLDAYLRDAQTGQTVNLRTQPAYAFTVSAAQATALLMGRFSLQFSAAAPLAATPAALAALVSLYPNPAHGAFAVQLPDVAGASTVQVELLNALGQVVRRQSAALPASGTTLTVETSGLAAGVYTLRLRAGNAALAKRVVLN